MALDYLKKMRSSIEKLSRWESSGEAFGFISKVGDRSPDYIYEFFCSMKLLEDLSKNHHIILIPGARGKVFPQKPGDKMNWARFEIQDKKTFKTILQFCLGTKIKITASPLSKYAPDISVQKHDSSNNPTENDVILIMDAKYKQNPADTLEINIIREFSQCASDFNVPKPEKSILSFSHLSDLNANCLFTNGIINTDHDQYCINHNIKQVGGFV